MKAENFIQWWKKDNRYRIFLRAIFLACLPLAACLVYCAVQGESIGQVYLPSSGRNDELLYYKQVEGILEYGCPRGFFGYNESHAMKLSFAAWSPVIMLPWILWGLIFGWNLLSPVLCNIVMMIMAMFLFGVLVKPSGKQTGVIALLFFLYEPFVWYMLSGMPEIIFMSGMIVFYSLVAAYLRERRGALLLLLFLLSGILTLMRPYMLLFMLLPAYFWISCADASSEGKKGFSFKTIAVKWKQLLGSCLIMGGVLLSYALINHYFAAEYFEPLFSVDWITAFFEKGLLGGIRNFFGSLYYAVLEFWGYMRQGMMSGLAAGSIFCCYIAMLLVLLYQTLRDAVLWRRSEEKRTGGFYRQLVTEAHLTLSFLGMLAAQLLMYNFYDGCKHLMIFLAVGIPVIGLMDTKFYKKAVLMGVVFAYFFVRHSAGFQDYHPAFVQEPFHSRMESWESAVQEALSIEGDESPGYENVVIWVLTDERPEGIAYTGWQYLYALPAGFGINCCTSDYVLENLETLRSRYLCVAPGGRVEEACVRMNYEMIAENDAIVLYRRY